MKLQFKSGLCVAMFINYSNYLGISPLEERQIKQIGGGKKN